MARVTPLALNQMPAPLQEAVANAHRQGVLSVTLPLQVWAHRPNTALPWLQTLTSFYSESLLGERLRELVRLKISTITQCKACQLARKSQFVSEQDVACLNGNDDSFSEIERIAVNFAERFAGDYAAINDDDFSQLRLHFSEAAIVELCQFCALMLAGGRLTYVLNAFE